MGRMEIEKDRKFGEWTVIGEAPRTHAAPRMWYCRCTCGRVVPVRGARLLADKTSRCRPCALERMRKAKAKSYTGRKLGTRKVIGPGDVKGTWRIRCKCGREDVVKANTLQAGPAQKCRSCAASGGRNGQDSRRRSRSSPVARVSCEGIPNYLPTPDEIRAACLAIRRELGHDIAPDLS